MANAPAYLSISGTTLTITSDSLEDEEDIAIVTVHVTVTGNPCVAEPLDYCVDFIVGLSCPTDTICDFTGPFVPETLPEVGCWGGDGGPQTLSGYTGIVGDNPGYDDWYIEYGNYMLTKIKLYGDSEVTSGFEAYFDAYPPSEFSGWPQLYHLYGTRDLPLHGEIDLDKDVVSLGLCCGGPGGFEGIRVLEFFEDDPKALNTDDCTSWFDI